MYPRGPRIDEDVQHELNELVEGLREEFKYSQRILCDLEDLLDAIFRLTNKMAR